GRIQQVQQVAQEELQKKNEELFAPIIQKANTAIQSVAKEKGYAYVFDIANPGISYFAGGDDLTADVKTKLGISGGTAPAAQYTRRQKRTESGMWRHDPLLLAQAFDYACTVLRTP